MQIVIDIPEEIIKLCKDDKVSTVKLSAEYFRNGTVLPEHGRLIDVDNIQEIQLEDSLTVLTHKKGDEVDWYINAPTILEANKEQTE